MSYRFSIETERDSRADKLSADQEIIDNGKNKGLADLKQGQRITGTVVSVEEQVTLDFGGQEVTTPKSVLRNVIPGDVKNFEVVKATASKIELRLLDENSNKLKTITADIVKDADWDTLMAKKEQAALKAGQETEYNNIKEKLDQISATLTDQDYRLLEDEGFPLESFTVEGLSEALTRIKSETRKTDNNKANENTPRAVNHVQGKPQELNIPANTAKSVKAPEHYVQKGLSADKAVLEEKLKEEKLPVTEENLTRLSQALKLSDSVKNMDDKTMHYLILTDSQPSVENIYKAYYSKSSQSKTDSGKLSEEAWSELENQVKTVIREAGYEVTDKNLTDAKWLIENKLPLTAETFTYKKALEDIKTDSGKEDILNVMLKGMKSGLNPKDVSLLPGNMNSCGQMITKINTISDEAITQAIQKNCELTIKNLINIQDNITTAEVPDGKDKAESYIVKTSADIIKSAENITKIVTEISDAVTDMKSSSYETASARDENPSQKEQKVSQIADTSAEITKLAADITKTAENITEAVIKENSPPKDTDTLPETSGRTRIPYEASDIIRTATEITKKAVEIANNTSEISEEVTGSAGAKPETAASDSALNITKAAVDITREISDITKAAMKLIDITQDIEKPVLNLVQTPSDNSIEEEARASDTDAEQKNGENTPADSKDYPYEELKAKRQLEEIRLKMTLEAAGRLEKKGIMVDTQELSKVVDALREQEDSYYKDLLREADAEVDDASVQTLKDTTQGIEKLKFMPSSVLGSTLSIRSAQTITGLIEEGSRLQAEYEKAGVAYETLATVPNSEYGDSIKKAFANAASLLNQIGMEDTEQNRRAVRILGYNQMEIMKDSVNQVKAYDQQVSDLIRNLHPAVTIRMIKEGSNPLQMPINELNRTIDRIKEEQGISSEDKYSTYLRNLEKQEGITAEDRKAYIGIYRLLYNVDKSDGAALGAVIKADREVTLGNLLTAVQTNSKGSMNAAIDDDFGTLQSISHPKETIAEQLSPFSGRTVKQPEEQTDKIAAPKAGQAFHDSAPLPAEEPVKEQTEYLNRILKHIKEELSPEKLMQAGSSPSLTEASQKQATAVQDQAAPPRGIWETVKGVPVEKLLEQLRSMEDVQRADHEAYTTKVQEIRELSKNAEQSIRFLNDYKLPSTPLNIMMANSLLSNGESPIKKLLKLKNENTVENPENELKEISNLSDKLDDKNSMQEAYEALETDAKEVVSQACSEGVIDSRRLAELKSMGQQVTFLRSLAEKEFYQIPIETEKGITNMNLTILRGTQTSGKVSVDIRSEQLGNIKAEFSLKDHVLKGYFSSDDRGGLKQLQGNTGMIEAAAQESNITIKQIDFGVQSRENDNYSYQNSGKAGASVTDDTERTLYRIAKAIVQTVRMAENSGDELSKAVS